jgi:hypothetical protein
MSLDPREHSTLNEESRVGVLKVLHLSAVPLVNSPS